MRMVRDELHKYMSKENSASEAEKTLRSEIKQATAPSIAPA